MNEMWDTQIPLPSPPRPANGTWAMYRILRRDIQVNTSQSVISEKNLALILEVNVLEV